MHINVFGVDPGVTTGWAFLRDVDLDHIPEGECDIDMMCGQFSGIEDQQAIDMAKIIDYAWPCAVVIEDFVPQHLNKDRHFLSPVRVTAKLELLLYQRDRRCTRQMPSTAMSTIHDDYMREIGMWSAGQPHANDAVRHGLLFLRRAADDPQMAHDLLEPLGFDAF